MKVAVITPYYKEPEAILVQCHTSVIEQSYSCDHILVADGHPADFVSTWDCQHIVLPQAHHNNGNTPRAIGSLSAITQKYDAIAYLDADNWFEADHIQSLVNALLKTDAVIAASGRSFRRLDGTDMKLASKQDGAMHIDTSCLLIGRGAFSLAPLWSLMPDVLSPICDRVLLIGIAAKKYKVAYTGLTTMAFRTQYAHHYESIGETPPEGAKNNVIKPSVTAWNALPSSEKNLYFEQLGFSFNF